MASRRPPGNAEPAERSAYYESDVARQHLARWYKSEKEETFIEFLFSGLRVPSTGLVIEIGGGGGIHGAILVKRFGSRYLFTDLSMNLVSAAASSGLQAKQMDGLKTPLHDGEAACAVLIATSTLLHDRETRQRQFAECARILQPDGVAIFVTSHWDRRYHTFDREDMTYLAGLGFSVRRCSWGVIPGRFWRASNQCLFSVIEKIAAITGLAGRMVLIARRL